MCAINVGLVNIIFPGPSSIFEPLSVWVWYHNDIVCQKLDHFIDIKISFIVSLLIKSVFERHCNLKPVYFNLYTSSWYESHPIVSFNLPS